MGSLQLPGGRKRNMTEGGTWRMKGRGVRIEKRTKQFLPKVIFVDANLRFSHWIRWASCMSHHNRALGSEDESPSPGTGKASYEEAEHL